LFQIRGSGVPKRTALLDTAKLHAPRLATQGLELISE